MKPTRHLHDPDRKAAAPNKSMPRGRILTGTKMLEPSRPPQTDGVAVAHGAQANLLSRPTCGWLVVVAGPVRGTSFSVYEGLNTIGCGAESPVGIDPGDASLNPGIHLVLAYDPATRLFHVNHAGQAALVRLNAGPLLGPSLLAAGDRLQIGASVMVFIPFCGPDFDWQADGTSEQVGG